MFKSNNFNFCNYLKINTQLCITYKKEEELLTHLVLYVVNCGPGGRVSAGCREVYGRLVDRGRRLGTLLEPLDQELAVHRRQLMLKAVATIATSLCGQIWLLTQIYLLGFLQSRISSAKSFLQTHNKGLRQLFR